QTTLSELLRWRTESDDVPRSSASVKAARIIISITISLRAYSLKEMSKKGRLATKQALLHPITLPFIFTSNADGQQTFKSTSQEATPQPTPPPTGFIETGESRHEYTVVCLVTCRSCVQIIQTTSMRVMSSNPRNNFFASKTTFRYSPQTPLGGSRT
ncbi:hypothetical protein Lal_00032408, partial [Lupinus albus]